MSRPTDIEIYLLGCPVERLLGWLETILGKGRKVMAEGSATIYHFNLEGRTIPLVITPNIEEGPWMSAWLNSPYSPWATDLDWARAAAAGLECEVRCCPTTPEPPSTFIQLSNGQERLINWDLVPQ